MNKRILIAILLTISALMVGCGNKDTKVETSSNSVAVSQSKDSDNTTNGSNKSETTTINKYGTIQEAEKQGFKPKDSQWRTTHFENFGEVVFIGGLKEEDGKLAPKIYLSDNVSNILYEFPKFNGIDNGTLKDIASTAFMDYNNDQLLDVLVTANYTTDKGTVAVNNIFFQKGKEFINNKEYDELINTSLSNGTSNSVDEFIKKNPFKQ